MNEVSTSQAKLPPPNILLIPSEADDNFTTLIIVLVFVCGFILVIGLYYRKYKHLPFELSLTRFVNRVRAKLSSRTAPAPTALT